MLSKNELLISIKDVAEQLGVSVSTINNWIHEGLLRSPSKGYILYTSFKNFVSDSIGVTKLTTRANKQGKDTHDHNALSKHIVDLIQTQQYGHTIACEYECSLSESYRNKEGIYYTPQHIVDDMFQSIEGDVSNKTFLEPCCGGGNFVIAALKRGFKIENIYACDIDTNAVAITKHRIKELTGKECKHIVCGDFLSISQKISHKFDYIFTNPPWGKKLPKKDKNKWSKIYHTGNSADTCSLFLSASLYMLKKNGILGFLLPESFYFVASFEDIRRKVLNYNIIKMTNYGKFGNLLTKSHSLILSNAALSGKIECESETQKYYRNQLDFHVLPKHIFNFTTNDEDNSVISYLYSLPHHKLLNNAQWALGIVTGNNKHILKTEKEENCVPIYRGQDITSKGISIPKYCIDKDLSRCQQVAPVHFYFAKEKVVYRFISNRIICCCDRQQSLILNSANLFIVNENFLLTNQQVADMLNSDLMSWLFQHIFNTYKILRSDLEQLPLFHKYYEHYAVFNEANFLIYLNLEKNNGTYRVRR